MRLAHYNNRSTITSREIQAAFRLLLPDELAEHAVSELIKASRSIHVSSDFSVFHYTYSAIVYVFHMCLDNIIETALFRTTKCR